MPDSHDTGVLTGTIPLDQEVQSPFLKFFRVFGKVFDGPTTWVRENIVEKYRGPAYPYYHQKFERAPTIDQCYSDDMACIFEANKQFERDRKVDAEILKILKNRYWRCCFYNRTTNEYHDVDTMCLKEKGELETAELNFFLKYGEIGPYATVIDAFMRQKHRLIFERRMREAAEAE